MDLASGSGSWTSATVGQTLATQDRLRTGENSRAAVRMTDLSVVRIDELTTIQITPPSSASDKPSLSIKEGATYFFSREKSHEMKIETPAANGAMRGTEFVVAVAANGEVLVVPGLRHMGIWEAPKTFTDAMLDFLARRLPRP